MYNARVFKNTRLCNAGQTAMNQRLKPAKGFGHLGLVMLSVVHQVAAPRLNGRLKHIETIEMRNRPESK